MANVTTYESDSLNRIAPESITQNSLEGLEIVDGEGTCGLPESG